MKRKLILNILKMVFKRTADKCNDKGKWSENKIISKAEREEK